MSPRCCATAGGHGRGERRRPGRARGRRAAPTAGGRCVRDVEQVHLCSVEAGFQLADDKLAVLSEAEFYGRTAGVDSRQVKRLASRRKNVVDPLQLRAGDFVVHQTHGIGRFVELVQREVASGTRTPRGPLGTTVTAAKVRARVPGARVRAEQARACPATSSTCPPTSSTCSPATSAARRPRCRKMGGSDWAAAKGKARKAVRDIAVELVKLYSARMASVGHAFPPDTPWQRELEEAFPFVETPDQLVTIDEVKADMERPIPMDRLISGDVGYGKTEIAIRAAFKAVQDGKQVAMLVPTTLLVRQHMETFTERFAGFPVHLRALSRFQTDKEAKETIEGLATRRGGCRDRHASPAQRRHPVQGSRPGRHRRGAALRRRAQGRAQEAEDQRRHPGDVGDADPAHARDGGHRHPRDVDAGDAAGGPAPDPHLRRPVQRQAGRRRRSGASCCARARCSSCTTGSSSINRVAAQIAELVPEARVAVAHGQLQRERARAGHRRLLGGQVRRAGHHDDHRDRHRHRQREHPDHRPGRQVRAQPAAPDPRAGSAAGASGRTPTSSTTTTSRSASSRRTGSRPSRRTTSSAAACRSR